MNLMELRKLNDGDMVVFIGENNVHFTNGKEYKVVHTGVGRMIYNDHGMGIFLNNVKESFEKVKE